MEVAPLGQGANGQVNPPIPPTTIDPELLVQHLAALLEITLGASAADLENKGSLLSDSKRSDTAQRCLKFASEAQVALYVQKDAISTNEPRGLPNGHDESGKELLSFVLSHMLRLQPRTYHSIPVLHFDRNLLFLHDCSLSGTHKTPCTYQPASTPRDPNPGPQSTRCCFAERGKFGRGKPGIAIRDPPFYGPPCSHPIFQCIHTRAEAVGREQ